VRTRQQYTDAYAVSHRNAANQVIHLVCVPAIFFATVAFGYLVPLGPWPGVNLATVASIPVLLFYARLGWPSFLTGLSWLLASLLLCQALQSIGAPLLLVAMATFVVAWVVQFVGHRIEGAKPSFIDDLLFLLIGPLFVQDKLARLVRTGSLQAH
jgi:uncharacterized membrane protein YGL010W